jgi:hypothetical protein
MSAGPCSCSLIYFRSKACSPPASPAGRRSARYSTRAALSASLTSAFLFLPLFPFAEMFSTVAKAQTTELWMWKMEYLHHEQRPLYFGEWF